MVRIHLSSSPFERTHSGKVGDCCGGQSRFIPVILLFGLLVLLALSAAARAQERTEPWSTLLNVIRYAATTKASFRVGCKTGHLLSTTPAYLIICPKLDQIPDSAIETAALPCMKQHVAEDLARRAISFWSTPTGQQLSLKSVREIESGINDQLSAEELQLLDARNRSDFGLALSTFANERECSRAVARAMLRYEP